MGIDTSKIKSLRTEKGLSLSAAAKAAGLSNRQHWFQIESGLNVNITMDTLERIAKALGVKPKDLLK